MIEKEQVKQGLIAKHNNGNVYTVLFLANIDGGDPLKYPVSVIYQGFNGKVWVKTLEDFCNKFTAESSVKLEIELPISKLLGMESSVTLNVTPEFEKLYKLREAVKGYIQLQAVHAEKVQDIYSWFYCHGENELDGLIRGCLEEVTSEFKLKESKEPSDNS